jgi:protocatechuate 3,4-dioxygenase beta subunit
MPKPTPYWIVIFALGLTASAQTWQPQQTATIEGTVTRAGTGQPLKGAQVTLERSGPIAEPGALIPVKSGVVHEVEAVSVATTDGNGRYAFTGVDPGQYRISAERDGYVRSEYGQRTPTAAGTPVSVVANQRRVVDLQMSPTSVVSGRVLNEDGEPVSGVTVVGYMYKYSDGGRTMTEVASVQTNDLGEYRLFNLLSGDYFLGVKIDQPSAEAASVVDVREQKPGASQDLVHFSFSPDGSKIAGKFLSDSATQTFYYPGTVDPDAAVPVSAPVGSEVRGVDVTLRRVRTATLSGRVTAPFPLATEETETREFSLVEGKVHVTSSVEVFLSRIGSGRSGLAGLVTALVPLTSVGPNGTFEIKGVPPGPYHVIAIALDADGKKFTGRTRLNVGLTDIPNIALSLRAGIEVLGRVVVEGTPPAAFDVSKLQVSLIAEQSTPQGKAFWFAPGGDFVHVGGAFRDPDSGGKVAADGSFTVSNIGAMLYRVVVSGLPSNAYLQSGRIGSEDALNAPFSVDAPTTLQLVIGFSTGRLSGTVVDAKGAAFSGAQVVLVPDEARRGRSDAYFKVVSELDGEFALNDIPPGGYKLFAWEDVPAGAYQYPEFLRAFEDRGTSVTVGPNTQSNANIRVLTTRD